MSTQSDGNTVPNKFEDIEALDRRLVHPAQATPRKTDQF